MIPRSAGDVDALAGEVRRQSAEVAGIFGELPDEVTRWRPDETRWSLAGHVAHLAIINRAYLDVMEEKILVARARDDAGGPFRHPRITTRFVAMMEPPPARRVKTFRSMVPDPDTEGRSAVDDFTALQARLEGLLDRSGGLDLGRVRFGSPFLPLLRFSLGTGFAMILAHNRRHLWLMRELMRHPDFPACPRVQ